MLPALVDDGRRMLIFSQFTEMLDARCRPNSPRSDLASLGAHWRDAGERSRGALVKRSFRPRTVPIFLLSLKAGGVGLNLTAADTVIHLDPWWNPAVEQPSQRPRAPHRPRPAGVRLQARGRGQY